MRRDPITYVDGKRNNEKKVRGSPKTTPPVKIDRLAWLGVLATFAVAILFAARELSIAFKLTPADGVDLRVVCASFAALSEGKDPYLVNIGGGLSFPYAIVMVYPAKFLCPI